MRLGKNRRKKLNNKGYAMVLVIVAIALGMVLVGVLLNLSLLNYQMKITEYHAKDTFYSAEEILDQVNVGLQTKISKASSDAYIKAMQTYKLAGVSEEERMNNFKTDYLLAVKTFIEDTSAGVYERYYVGGDDTEYDASKGVYTKGLVSLLDKDMAQLYKERNSRTTNIINISCATAAGSNSLIYATDGLVMKDLLVEYVDGSGYYSAIKTDIMINFPSVSLREASVIPNVFEYAMIADNAFLIENASLSVGSSVYCGTGGFMLSGASDVTLTNTSDYLVTKGNVEVNNLSVLDIQADNVWAKNVNVVGGDLVTDTNTALYVADDLNILGSGAEVILAGKYYGYNAGSHPDASLEAADAQSAIILNGREAKLDMRTLNELFLSGTSYVKPNKEWEDGAPEGNDEVQLGNSLSVKTDQIVFLVPPECLGTKDGVALIGRNPMTQTEYNEWLFMKNDSGYRLIDMDRTVEEVGHPLKHYLPGGVVENHYQKIFHTVNGETLCYVYLEMDADTAAQYYADYVATSADKLNKYMSKYKNEIFVDGSYTDINSKGNILTYANGSSVSFIPNNLTMGSDEFEKALDFEEKSRNSYSALCSKLTTNYNGLTTEELTNNSVYVNLLNHSVISALTEPAVFSYGSTHAIIWNQSLAVNDGQKVTLPGGTTVDNVKLIITSGDVELQGSFSGLIICGGTVKIHNTTAASLTNDNGAVTKLLQQPLSATNPDTVIQTYFKNGERYVLSSASGENSGYIDLENVITYMNWTKQ